MLHHLQRLQAWKPFRVLLFGALAINLAADGVRAFQWVTSTPEERLRRRVSEHWQAVQKERARSDWHAWVVDDEERRLKKVY